MSTDCLFCKIVAKQIPANIICESTNTIAFADINPQAPIHVLVIPKKHIASFDHLAPEDGAIIAELIATCQEVAKITGLKSPGYRVVTNIGQNGGQTVGHLHFHVLGGRALTWPPG
jgi:histidine triad (HIT) family protein